MSDETGLFLIVRDGVHILPVLHERLEFADLVRWAFERLRPEAVAVEIPSSLERVWRRAVDRLPWISVVLYENARDQTIYLPVQPADPMAEAARRAGEQGLPIACADLDVDGYADYRDPLPDSYAVLRLGLGEVYRAFDSLPRPADPTDAARGASMAYHARRLQAEGARRVLVVCGMHHARGVADALGREQAIPLTRPVRRNARLMHLHPDSLGEVLQEIPFYVAAYEARRHRLPPEPSSSEPAAAGRQYGPFRVLSGGAGDAPERIADAVHRAATRAGWWSWNAYHGRRAAGPIAPDRQDDAVLPGPLDRLRLQWALLHESERALGAAAPDERVEAWQRHNLARYTRNLARLSGQLVCDLYDLLVAARACVSENFAWEAHRTAVAYPHQGATVADLPIARIRAEEMFDGVRRIRLTHRMRRTKRGSWSELFRRRRPEERRAGEWLASFDGEAICSYPPEDVVVEEFGRYLRQRGRLILSEERSRSVPFTTSVLDGIDMRETIRHLPEGGIRVRELGRVPGGVGSVVVIFDEDDEPPERFPHRQIWIGEHDQESDMAFYCTDPAQGIVGPGICRVTYGGLLLSYPPCRLLDVWRDPDYRVAERKSEVLLLAALDYAEERWVVHVAARPPRSMFQQLAARVDRRILFVPTGTLSPATLRRIRVMHILSGHDKRPIAKDYIW
jgi:hypothetical protein